MSTDSTPAAPADGATPESDEILELFRRWNDALVSRSAARVAALYHPEAVLVPTLSNELRTTPGAIRSYFQKLIDDRQPSVALHTHTVRRFGTTAINSGTYRFTFGDGTWADARYTFAYHASGGGWLISAHHSSLLYREIAAGKANVDPSF